jgi:plastocyanin
VANALKNKTFVTVVLAVLVVGAVAAYLVPKLLDQAAHPDIKDAEYIVEITADGFSPATLKVPVGAKVVWVNKDSNPHRVASNPYPDGTDLPGLDSKDPIGPDSTYAYTFSKTGTFGYHDHYKPSTNGQITVGN